MRAFEVASIKPARPGARGYSIRPFPGRLKAENGTLKLLRADAYHVYDFQISGPKWIALNRYDLEAKSSGDVPPSKTQLRAMLQKLLAERFGVRVRRESKEMRVYVLQLGRQTKSAVINSMTSKTGQRTYEHAITEFVDWYCSEPRLAFNRTVVLRYRIFLEQRQRHRQRSTSVLAALVRT